jgi:hypothetical protein
MLVAAFRKPPVLTEQFTELLGRFSLFTIMGGFLNAALNILKRVAYIN